MATLTNSRLRRMAEVSLEWNGNMAFARGYKSVTLLARIVRDAPTGKYMVLTNNWRTTSIPCDTIAAAIAAVEGLFALEYGSKHSET